MTCKDCLHFEVCKHIYEAMGFNVNVDNLAKFTCPMFKKLNQDQCDYCRGVSYTDKPFKVITQMGREVEVQFNFCPNCGRNIVTILNNDN